MKPATLLLVCFSVLMLALRLECAQRVDFGDAEALYASYSLFPQASYLDHPGLIGWLYRRFGAPPNAATVHLATSVFACALPWLLRAGLWFALGPAQPHAKLERDELMERASWLALAFAVLPVIAVGTFALTPDTPLALSLLLGCAFAVRAAQAQDGRPVDAALAGALFAASASAKLSGVVFLLSYLVLASRLWRGRARALAWLGAALGALSLWPMLQFEAARGFPMLRHRLAPPSALPWGRSFGMLSAGQLLYLSPLAAVLIALLLWRLWRTPADAAPQRMARGLTLGSLLGLTLASLASPQVEPHWLAPVLLPLAFALWLQPALGAGLQRGLVRAALGLSASLSLLVHAWVLWPSLSAVLLPDRLRQDDISRELFGQNALRQGLTQSARQLPVQWPAPTYVAPHWTLCARLRTALPAHIEVGCATPGGDDFDGWLPRAEWQRAPVVVWVSDDRFDDVERGRRTELPQELAAYTEYSKERAQVYRGGEPSRRFVWRTLLQPEASRALDGQPAAPPVPAAELPAP